MSYRYIISNPYIVGNPIKSREMFFGREEDFRFIKEKLQHETKGIIITLAGERRSGKTSILFQILNGRLGYDYLPFFIDMQTMADVDNNREFMEKIDDAIRNRLHMESRETQFSGEGFKDMEQAIIKVKTAHPYDKLVFLFDEYELLENKIEKGQIHEDTLSFFASLMENHNVLFVFAGSNKIRDRSPKYWGALFSKSIYRNITFLNQSDCSALIRQPVAGYVQYLDEYVNIIYRLTAGQPFYTQIFCQNMVDWLRIEQRNEVKKEDLRKVIQDIIDHPIPQMIYFWNELTRDQKIILSAAAEIIRSGNHYTNCEEIRQFLKERKLGHLINLKEINVTLEELYHLDILNKESPGYQFKVDLFRYWAKQDQNIWKVVNDHKDELPEPEPIISKQMIFGLASVILLAVVFSLLWPLLKNIGLSETVKTSEDIPSAIITKDDLSRLANLAWWDSAQFYPIERSQRSNRQTFREVISLLASRKEAKYSANGNTDEAGFNSENFARALFRARTTESDKFWNKEIPFSESIELASGDLIKFKDGHYLFYFYGKCANDQQNRELAIGMTTRGVKALSFSPDSIESIRRIKKEKTMVPQTVSEVKKFAIIPAAGIEQSEKLQPYPEVKRILRKLIEYERVGNDTSRNIPINKYRTNPQGFIYHILATLFNIQPINSGDNQTDNDLFNWLKRSGFSPSFQSPGKEIQNGYIIFYELDGKEYPFFFINSGPEKMVAGMTESGVKFFKFLPERKKSMIVINYYFFQKQR